MKRIEYRVFAKLKALLIVAAACGGSDHVRYGRHGPEKRYVAELELRRDETIWIFVHIPGDGRIAARVLWREDVWALMASYGVQTEDCPTEIWAGSARFFRKENIPRELLTLEQALAAHESACPGTVHSAEFEVAS